ncbi:MFS transporter [Companilactobacillus sp. RD055328]|uniref:MFS transporter n=1 Tax=Companilactobacillus sp. RD055328 TaxID=2916634 RepID=UPI001FC7F414|nr:MFS transporter [Companilactobacillus sp. RD055328]GKQ42840.1 MFS transporter [Companilactobacillus sp. RD055328]
MKTNVNPNRWKILIAVNLFTFMSVLDGSIVNIALPTMGRDLNIPMNQAEWVVSIYLIVICAFLILFGKLGDTIGKVKIFQLGGALFILGSLLCGFNHSLLFLLFGRTVQAIGAAMTMSTNNGIITEVFPATERGQALGWVGSFVALGSIAGPGLGGIILGALPWGYIFWINVPVGIFAFIFGQMYLPKDETTNKSRIDYLGFMSYFLAIVAFFGAIFVGQEIGFSNVYILLAFIIAIILFTLFVRRQRSISYPLINFEIFKNGNFSISLLCGFLIFVTNFFFNVISPFYLQNARGMNASHAGYVLMIFPLVQVIVAPFAGRISDRVSPMMMTFIGLVIIAISQVSYALMDLNTPLWMVMIFIGLVGFGNGIFQAPNNSIVMSSVDKKYLGIAGGLNSLARNMGMIIGISLATTILFSSMSSSAGYSVTTYLNDKPEIFISGMHVTFWAAFGICILALITTGIRWYRSNEQTK